MPQVGRIELREVPGPADDVEEDAASDQGQATDGVDDERLHRGAAGGDALVVEADEQERCEGGQLPKDEQRNEAVGEDERGGSERHLGRRRCP